MIKHDPVSDWQAAVTVLQELAGAAAAPRRSPEAAPALAEPTAHSDACAPQSAQAAAGADLGTTGLVDAWSEQTLRTLLETLPDALAVISRAGAIVLVNQETEKIFGYQRRELLGQPIEILDPPAVSPRAREQSSGVLQVAVQPADGGPVPPCTAGARTAPSFPSRSA